jgi:predicted NUDIX family NTP pyrophosphohydrolase
VLYNSTNWIQRHSLAASAIVTGNLDGDASGKSDMVIVFPGAGVWAFMNNASWTLLHGADAQTLATGDIDGDGKADLILSFPGYGIWVLKNLATWTAIHGLTPEALVSGRMNAN